MLNHTSGTEGCLRTADPQIIMLWLKEVEINWRTFHIAIDFRAAHFSRHRHAWCNDCVSFEEAYRIPTDSHEEDKLRTWSTSISVQPELMKQCKDSQLCSFWVRFRVPGPCRAAILDCRTIHGILRVLEETFLNDYLLEKDKTSTLFNNSKNLTTSSQELRPDKTETAKKQRVKWYESRRTRRYLYHASKVEVDCSTILVELILTVVWLIIRYFQCRNCIWANFLTVKFQSWKVNFKTEVCSKSADLHLTMLWIKEVEIAKSIDDLLTSQSTTGRRDFSDYDMLDEMSVCIEKTSWQACSLPQKSKCRRAACSKKTTDSNEGKIAYMIYEHFPATVAREAVQGLSFFSKKKDSRFFFSIRLQNDDVQDFDVRWDQALLSASEHAFRDVILGGLHKTKSQDAVQLRTVLALYDQETVRNNRQTSYLRLKTSVKLLLIRWRELETSESRTKLWKEEQ